MLPVGTNVQITKLPKATLTLIALNIAVFVLEVLSPAETIRPVVENLAFSPKSRNPLSLVMSLFLHADFFHLFGNMLYLWIFGGPVEERIGPKLFTYYYFGAGLWSSALWGLVASIANPDNPGRAIGASGAISGIMALFLYRCYYGKIKLTLPVLPTWVFAPWARFSIPAAPLLVYWFLRDVVGGFSSIGARGGVAYFGHVGGFLFGLAVGRIKRYGHEGQLEQAKAKLLAKIEKGFGWKTINAERELLRLLDLAPRDPEVHHQLARYYSENARPREAAEHYLQTVSFFFPADPVAASYALIEHADALKKPMAAHLHLKAAEALVERGFLEDASRALASAAAPDSGAIGERIRVLQIKIAWAREQPDEARELARRFQARHPAGRFPQEIERVMSLQPSAVFPPMREAAPMRSAVQAPTVETVGENSFFSLLGSVNRLIADPLFLFLWVFMLSWGGRVSWRGVAFTFFLTLTIVAFYRVDWFHHWSRYGRRSEEDARKEVHDTITFDRAALAERGDNFPKAAALYEKLLTSDPNHLQARYNLARIYHRRLGDLGNALQHFKRLAEHAPEGHPFREEAIEIMKNPKRFEEG